jgi:hypothetical protein
MLLHNQIAGLIPVEQNQEGDLLYQTQGLMNWREFIRQKPSQNQLLEIANKMIQTMCGLEEYMLEPNQIIFEEDSVYIDPHTLEPFLCYIPKEMEKHAFWGGLKGLGMLLVRDELYEALTEYGIEKHLPDMAVSKVGKFDSWEIINENTAIKTCDKSFFEHNGSGVPRGISWFFDAEDMQSG